MHESDSVTRLMVRPPASSRASYAEIPPPPPSSVPPAPPSYSSVRPPAQTFTGTGPGWSMAPAAPARRTSDLVATAVVLVAFASMLAAMITIGLVHRQDKVIRSAAAAPTPVPQPVPAPADFVVLPPPVEAAVPPAPPPPIETVATPPAPPPVVAAPKPAAPRVAPQRPTTAPAVKPPPPPAAKPKAEPEKKSAADKKALDVLEQLGEQQLMR